MGSVRLRVSSALKYAFAWGVHRSPSGYDPGYAFQRVQPGQTGLPTRTCRALRRDGIPSAPPRSGIHLTGYHHSRPTRWTGRGGVGLRLFTGGLWTRRVRWGRRPRAITGDAGTSQYGRAEFNDSGRNSRPSTARWIVPHRVGFILRLKTGPLLILGPIAEVNLRRSLKPSDGQWTCSFRTASTRHPHRECFLTGVPDSRHLG